MRISDVDILTRGNYLKANPSSNISKANYIFGDRLDFKFLQRLNLNSYDLVFDNNCYFPESAKLITDLFEGSVVAVSSSAVSWYEENRNVVGKQNKGISYQQSRRVRTYAINKESCESVYMKANGSVIRLPNILSLSDPFLRLKKLIFFYKTRTQKELGVNLKHHYIDEKIAAQKITTLIFGRNFNTRQTYYLYDKEEVVGETLKRFSVKLENLEKFVDDDWFDFKDNFSWSFPFKS